MDRRTERLIDLCALAMLLVFAWLLRDPQPALAGVVVASAVQFWMTKNAQTKETP